VDKTRALALSRRLRDAGAAVARDIISRPLAESLAYARGQHAVWALIIGTDGTDPDLVRIQDLRAARGPAAAFPGSWREPCIVSSWRAQPAE